jgi:CRP/FNR family transcriptional regulator, cyclic AMP receptor protein
MAPANTAPEGRTMNNLEQIVAELPLFTGMKEEHIVLLAGCARNVRFEAGEFVGRLGEPADSFWAIREGRIALQIHGGERGTLTVLTMGENDVLGWSWLVPPHHWHFDARALTSTRAIAFDGRCLRGRFEDDYEFGFELLKRFSHIIVERLEATGLQLLDACSRHD